jgi:hypothetical protein
VLPDPAPGEEHDHEAVHSAWQALLRKTRIFIRINPSPNRLATAQGPPRSAPSGTKRSQIDAGRSQRPGHIPSSRCQEFYRRVSHRRNFVSSNMDTRWWSQTGSNRRPEACKATALPAELWPQSFRDPNARQTFQPNIEPHEAKQWWAWEDLNFRPHAYQARALTN